VNRIGQHQPLESKDVLRNAGDGSVRAPRLRHDDDVPLCVGIKELREQVHDVVDDAIGQKLAGTVLAEQSTG
jgi:hypothetical protein